MFVLANSVVFMNTCVLRTKSAKVCLPLLLPISDHVIIQLREYFTFIFAYSHALSDV